MKEGLFSAKVLPFSRRCIVYLQNIINNFKIWSQRSLEVFKARRYALKFPSINFEIMVIYTSILGCILIIFSGVLYIILFSGIYIELDKELALKAQNIDQNISSYLEVKGDTPDSLQFAVDKTIANEGKRLNRWWYTGFERQWFQEIDEMDISQNFINFVQVGGGSLNRSPNLSVELEESFLHTIEKDQAEIVRFANVNYRDRNIRVINYPVKFQGGTAYIIQVGVYQKEIMALVFNWFHSIIYSIPIILIITSFIGRILVRRILKPVEQISSIARDISYEDLSLRVKVDKPYVEIHYLIDDFNNMIERLEKSFKHIEEFSSQVAHELKTPLTIIKGETELALYENRSVDDYRKAMNINLEEVDKMLKIVEDLLLLTKMNYQPQIFQFATFEFTEYFEDIFNHSKILAKEKNISVTFNCDKKKKIKIEADKVHLRRLFFNLIDNAIKFTPAGGRINLILKRVKDHVVVDIIDTGPGIPEQELSKIFNLFYRLESVEEGCGLGLSIAQRIAKSHHCTIEVKSKVNEGTTFTVTLPTV